MLSRYCSTTYIVEVHGKVTSYLCKGVACSTGAAAASYFGAKEGGILNPLLAAGACSRAKQERMKILKHRGKGVCMSLFYILRNRRDRVQIEPNSPFLQYV